ncbi:OsmC-like protein [Amycolatopsis arida]|uniref:OsmC-like protein n=1 Tax=Amycolatopsis arida TaxID=587909 RepID=A0A1I5Q9K2_9PSEU|nr:OsmC family protein [Amycolatopsis arida]TDX98764.1 OsmC-like protein [Amycolatopsis arida]SFP42949.1 OsmC-like protein [Amycolatopsis arida]
MRNSFNTAGFSEVVHETRDDPAEAWYAYQGKAHYSPRRGLSARNGPALLGRVKSARAFSLDLCDPGQDGDEPPAASDEPAPIDLALTGIASCSLKTLVGGGSARGVVFDTVEMLIEYGAAEGRSGHTVNCQFEVGGPAGHRLIAELLDQVQNHSPNHKTLTAEIPLDVHYADGSGHVVHERLSGVEPFASRHRPARRRVRWISGVQLESYPVPATGPPLRIDSPKQTTGVDWGPNPQEHLLMGMASDVAANLGRLSREHLGRQLRWEVAAAGGVDIRGLLHADPAAIVHLQDVGCTISVPGNLEDEPDLLSIARTAVEQSEVSNLICRRQAVGVSLKPPIYRAPSWQRGRAAS